MSDGMSDRVDRQRAVQLAGKVRQAGERLDAFLADLTEISVLSDGAIPEDVPLFQEAINLARDEAKLLQRVLAGPQLAMEYLVLALERREK